MENLTVNIKYIQFSGTNIREIVNELKTLNETFQVQKIEDEDENIKSVNIQFLKNDSRTTRGSLSIKLNDYLVKDNNGYQVYSENIFEKKFKIENDNDSKANKYDFSKKQAGQDYYYITDVSKKIFDTTDIECATDNLRYQNANYFPDKQTAKKFNKIQTLQRKLLRFSLENGGDKIDWNCIEAEKWGIVYEYDINQLCAVRSYYMKEAHKVYFISEEICEKAIEKFKDEIMEVYSIKW